MSPDPDQAGASTEELLEQLRHRVEERRNQGDYPAGLEDDRDSHFRRIASQRIGDIEAVQVSLLHLESTLAFNAARIPIASDQPGGELAHKALRKAFGRQTQGVFDQVRVFAEAVRDALQALVAVLETPGTHEHADLAGRLDTVLERLAQLERAPGAGAGADRAATADLVARIERLETAEQRRAFNPWFSNARFEEEFRGSREELTDHYRDLAARFEGLSPVLDVGCGRGEFLELLGEVGTEAIGIEIDPDLVRECAERGLHAELGDALHRIASVPDASLGGIVLIQVVEHLTAQEVVDLIPLAFDKLRPGGRILIETVNPQSLYVFAHSLYVDPTHHKPVHPAYLDFIFREAGFEHIELQWRSAPDAQDSLDLEEGEVDSVGANLRKIDKLLFGPQDYALIATR
jgi:SAM-dependent methyltransferase